MMSEMRTHCSICGSTAFDPTSFVNLMGLGANYVICRRCGVGCYDRTICSPTEAYDNDASHVLADNCLKFGAMNNLDPSQIERFQQAHKSLYGQMLKEIRGLLAPAPMTRIYEVGSNIGEFLQIARDDYGCEVKGCEPNKRGCEIAIEQGIDLEHAFFQQATPGSGWDACIMLDVIEHTSTPVEDLRKAHEILRPGGVLLIKTFYEEFHFGKVDPTKLQTPEAWKLDLETKGYYDPVQHVFHFPKALLQKVIRDAGFKLANVSENPWHGQLTIYGVKQ